MSPAALPIDLRTAAGGFILATPDLASPFSGPNPGPPFPGEDFLTGLPAGVVRR